MPIEPGPVVGIGLGTVDLIGVAPRTAEAKVELSELSMQGGGAAATALATLATFGVPTRYFARLGDDPSGSFIMQGLRELGVDVSQVLIEPGKASPVSLIHIEQQTRRRTTHYSLGNTTPLEAADLPAALLAGARLLTLDGSQPRVQIVAAEKFREAGMTVVLDAGHLGPGLGELLALSDVVVGSERFASEVAPSGEIEDSLVEISKMGPRMVVLTLGDAGSVGLDGNTLVHQRPLEVDIVDTTGAGDVFHGALVYGLLQGWSLERCMPFANAASALKCRSLGGRAGIPSLAETLAAAGG